MPEKLRLFFDIDETLANVPQKATPLELQTFFRTHGSIINIEGTPHYVFPGVRELMRLLLIDFSDNVEVAFFSAGKRWRNDIFVPLLLKEALGEEGYRHLTPKPLIFSYDNLTQITEEEMYAQIKKYRLPYASGAKKDLMALYSDLFTSDHMILIDDGSWNIAPGQEGNFLCGIRTVVDSYRARSNTVFEASFRENAQYREINSIYYITGLLLDCIERYQSKELSTYLFHLQFNSANYSPMLFNAFDDEHFKPCFEKAHKEEAFYHAGLQCLQILNADLNFHVPVPCTVPDECMVSGFSALLLSDLLDSKDSNETKEDRKLTKSAISNNLAGLI